MKNKISISVDQEVLDKIDASVEDGKFRNRSHAFEYGLKKVFDGSGLGGGGE
jgi:Arc/MetJ-type ribon-helix-helix transcriptional regulator